MYRLIVGNRVMALGVRFYFVRTSAVNHARQRVPSTGLSHLDFVLSSSRQALGVVQSETMKLRVFIAEISIFWSKYWMVSPTL